MFAQTTIPVRHPTRTGARAERFVPALRELVSIEGFPFAVSASAGEARAAMRLATRALATHDLLQRVVGVAPRLSLCVLDREDWLRRTEIDWYGTPYVSSNGDLVVGSEPADEWQDVSEYFARRLPSRDLAALIGVHGLDPLNRRGPALGSLAESLIAHEVAHVLCAQQRIVFPSRWLEEAFANYVLVAVLGDTDPAGLRLIGALAEAARALDDDLPTLREFERGFGPMDAVSSVLAELAITRAVYAAYAKRETAPLVDLFTGLRASTEPDADHELGRMLRPRLHPSIASIPAAFAAQHVGLAA